VIVELRPLSPPTRDIAFRTRSAEGREGRGQGDREQAGGSICKRYEAPGKIGMSCECPLDPFIAMLTRPSMKRGLSSRVEVENRFRAGVVEILLAVGFGRCVPFARWGLAANRWMIL